MNHATGVVRYSDRIDWYEFKQSGRLATGCLIEQERRDVGSDVGLHHRIRLSCRFAEEAAVQLFAANRYA
ncbi:hypothetical protein LOC67_03450 [Stieleria sp. JC731]|uniref:hypothetical protein n=1 Tax=Stieleria sp. JC731 TaxID=2894195 RepID=UPI001E517E11|nr:hypothetical protein [Stieleria sp. JC731]MCC9599604.1 hypothetical protein [Stieleria sp. JC731]